ncbi:MAG: hypothetical protein NT178_06005 [Proteobacteria bacterium]|nr:hypothetical protein [Pseudomonadota bacterium]
MLTQVTFSKFNKFLIPVLVPFRVLTGMKVIVEFYKGLTLRK